MALGLSGIGLSPKELRPLPAPAPLQFMDGRTLMGSIDPQMIVAGAQLGDASVAPLRKIFEEIGKQNDPIEKAKAEEAAWLMSDEGKKYRDLKRSAELSKLSSEALQNEAIAGALKGHLAGTTDADGNLSLSPAQPLSGANIQEVGTLPNGQKIVQVTTPTLKDVKLPGTNFSVKRNVNETKTHIIDPLSDADKRTISDLSSKTANAQWIGNLIESTIKTLDDPTISEEQKTIQGRQLIKTLNSQVGQDAVGAEEAKRLGSLLEFKVLNLKGALPGNPEQVFGVDLPGFKNQAKLALQQLRRATSETQKLIDEKTGKTTPTEVAKPTGTVVRRKSDGILLQKWTDGSMRPVQQ